MSLCNRERDSDSDPVPGREDPFETVFSVGGRNKIFSCRLSIAKGDSQSLIDIPILFYVLSNCESFPFVFTSVPHGLLLGTVRASVNESNLSCLVSYCLTARRFIKTTITTGHTDSLFERFASFVSSSQGQTKSNRAISVLFNSRSTNNMPSVSFERSTSNVSALTDKEDNNGTDQDDKLSMSKPGVGWSNGDIAPQMFPMTRQGKLQLYGSQRRFVHLAHGWSRVGGEKTNEFSRRTSVSSQGSRVVEDADAEAKAVRSLIAQLCETFYNFGWATGTGGGVSIRVGGPDEDRPFRVFVAPSGIQKEDMVSLRADRDQFFVLPVQGSFVSPRHKWSGFPI